MFIEEKKRVKVWRNCGCHQQKLQEPLFAINCILFTDFQWIRWRQCAISWKAVAFDLCKYCITMLSMEFDIHISFCHLKCSNWITQTNEMYMQCSGNDAHCVTVSKISVCISYTFTWLKLKSKQLQHFSDAKAYIKQPVICLYDSVCRINNISKFLTNKQNNFHHRRNTWFSLLHWLTVLWWKRNFARNSFLRRIS